MLKLDPADLEILLEVLAAQAPGSEVWVYGSRATGEAHGGSDLDLVLRNPGCLDRPQTNIVELRAALSESKLPILVEVLDWARIPEYFRAEIQRHRVLLRAPLDIETKAGSKADPKM